MPDVSIIIPARNETFTVYLITNKINGKQYIGQTTKGINRRWSGHLSATKSGHKYPICKAIRKYGSDNFNVVEIDSADSIDELNKLEAFYIDMYDTLQPNGYNLDSGGLNFKRHPDTCKKMSKLKKGKPSGGKGLKRSPETCEKLRQIMLGKPAWNKGKPMSLDTRAKMSAIRKGRPGVPHSVEFKVALSERNKGNRYGAGNKPEKWKKLMKVISIGYSRDATGKFIKEDRDD